MPRLRGLALVLSGCLAALAANPAAAQSAADPAVQERAGAYRIVAVPPRPERGDTAATPAPRSAPQAPSQQPGAAKAQVVDAEGLADAIQAALSEGAVAHPRLPQGESAAIAAFYSERGHRPLWLARSGGGDAFSWTKAAFSLQDRLIAAAEEGLDPQAYAALAKAPGTSAQQAAHADIALTLAVVLYARDARGARLTPSRLHPLITPQLALPSAAAVLDALSRASDSGAILHSFNPPHAGYRRLRDKLAKLRLERREEAGTPVSAIPGGPLLREGMRDERVPLIRARFGLDETGESGDPRLYDRRVASAIADFQRDRGLQVDGIFGSQTLAALLASDPARLEGDLIANMERWRWLPPEPIGRAVVVNIPEYTMRVVDGDRVIHEARAIVGTPDTPTPVFSDLMNHVVVSPSWTIPPSILRNEVLPGLRADPAYAARKGYEVIRSGNSISVRQPPGPGNALGDIKFMFPNSHHVYLHDTPNRRLFSTARRAYSHGCVRIENPFILADLLLRESGWGEQRLRGLIGDRERTVRIAPAVPVHLTYFTIVADDQGNVRSYEDLYGFNDLVRRSLGLRG